MPTPDARARAFEALAPISPVVMTTLREAQDLALQYRDANLNIWAGWTPAQQAAAMGSARFNWVVLGLRARLADLDGVTYFSKPSQEQMNLFLWQVGPGGLGMRVKRDPAELSDQSSATLFDMAPLEADQSACLTWSVAPGGEIHNEAFVAGHGAFWSISLDELVVASAARLSVSAIPQRGTVVGSARKPAARQSEKGAGPASTPS